MGETAQGLLQFGALGVVVLMLILAYKIITPVVTAWVTRKTNTPPETGKGQYDYNQQMATLIYDNSKNMSEMVIAVRNNTEILREVVKSQQDMFDIIKSHAQKSEQFHDTYTKIILSKLENIGVSD